MKAYKGSKAVHINTFGMWWSLVTNYTPRPLYDGAHCKGSWVDLRACLDVLEEKIILVPTEIRTPDRLSVA